MPEGDTIHRLADRLSRAAAGRTVSAFVARTLDESACSPLVGRTMIRAAARGKNLLVFFDDGRVLHLHLRMLGRVRIERKGAPRPQHPELWIELGPVVIRGYRIPVLRLLRERDLARSPDLAGLGPDLLAESFDENEALSRLRAMGTREIGDALMVQRAVSGIGNVYKSEILYLEKIDPRTRVAALDDEHLRRLLQRARRLLQSNVRSGAPRRTRSSLAGPRLWVYGRRGKPCLSCGAGIAVVRQGHPPGRSTYYCPRCQAGC